MRHLLALVHGVAIGLLVGLPLAAAIYLAGSPDLRRQPVRAAGPVEPPLEPLAATVHTKRPCAHGELCCGGAQVVELHVGPDELVAGVVDGPPAVATFPRDGRAWDRVRDHVARLAHEVDHHLVLAVVAEPGAVYRDLLTAFQIAGEVGLYGPRIHVLRARKLVRIAIVSRYEPGYDPDAAPRLASAAECAHRLCTWAVLDGRTATSLRL